MYNFLTKNGQLVALGLGILVIVIFFGSVISGFNSNDAIDMSTDLMNLDPEARSAIGFFNPGLGATVGLVILAAVLALVVFGIINIIKFPKQAMKFGIGLVVLAIIFFALYSTSSVESGGKLGMLHEREGITDNVSKSISGGLKTTVGLAIAAFVIMVISEIRNIFK